MDDEFFPSLSRAGCYNRSGDPIGLWQWAILHSEDNAIWCPRQRCGYRGDKAQFYKLKLVRPMLESCLGFWRLSSRCVSVRAKRRLWRDIRRGVRRFRRPRRLTP